MHSGVIVPILSAMLENAQSLPMNSNLVPGHLTIAKASCAAIHVVMKRERRVRIYPYQALKLSQYFHATMPGCGNNRMAFFCEKGTGGLSRTRHTTRFGRPINLCCWEYRSRYGGYFAILIYKQTAEWKLNYYSI